MASLIISLYIEVCGGLPFDAREKGVCVSGDVSNFCAYILKLLPISIISSYCAEKGPNIIIALGTHFSDLL